MANTVLEIDEVRRVWETQYGGEYPTAFIETYLHFVMSMAGTATFSMELLVDIRSELETGGLSEVTKSKLDALLDRNYMAIRQNILQSFQGLFNDPSVEIVPSEKPDSSTGATKRDE